MSNGFSTSDELKPELWLNRVLSGRYRIVARIGAGGMGVVYRAWDQADDGYVVIKMPRQELTSDATFLKRFDQELSALRNLEYPAVVPIIDCGQQDGTPFAVMPYLAGGSLRQQRSQQNKEAATDLSHNLWTWLPLVAQALTFVHQNGYVHRDVKPDNVLFNGLGVPYLGDFGVAKIVLQADEASHQRGLTGTGFALGTPEYMAPELIDGTKPDPLVDQYALAVMTYEWLAGKKPFDGPTPAAVIVAHASGIAPKLKTIRPNLPQTLSAAVMRGMSRNPKDRFDSCIAFASAVLDDVSQPSAPARLQLMCPQCQRLLNVKRDWAGKQGSCPKCKSALSIAVDLNSLWLEQDRRGQEITPLSPSGVFTTTSGAATSSGKWVSAGLAQISESVARTPRLFRSPTALALLAALTLGLAVAIHFLAGGVENKPQLIAGPSPRSADVMDKSPVPPLDAAAIADDTARTDSAGDPATASGTASVARTRAANSQADDSGLECLVLRATSGSSPNSFAFLSPQYLAAHYSDGLVNVWDQGSGQIVAEMLVLTTGTPSQTPFGRLAWQSDSAMLAVLGPSDLSRKQATQKLVTAHRRFLEARCLERGFSLQQVMECVVSKNGDMWTVDVEHPKYPRAQTGQLNRLGLTLLKWDESKASLTMHRRIEPTSGGSPFAPGFPSWSPDLSCCVTLSQPRTVAPTTVRSGTSQPAGNAMNSSGSPSLWLERPIEGRVIELEMPAGSASPVPVGSSAYIPRFSIAFSPDSSICAIYLIPAGRPPVIRLYDCRSGGVVGDVGDASSPVGNPLFFSYAGNLFATMQRTPQSTSIRLLGAPDWARASDIPFKTTSLSVPGLVSPDETQCFVAGNDMTTYLWNVASNSLSHLDSHDNVITAASFSPDGTLLATGSRDSTVRLWNMPSAKGKAVLRGHKGDIRQIAFSPDGSCLASAAADGCIRVWRVGEPSSPAFAVARRWISKPVHPDGEEDAGPSDGQADSSNQKANSGTTPSTASSNVSNGTKTERILASPPTRSLDSVPAGTIIENSIGMKFVRIPEGKFRMGSPQGEMQRFEDENQVDVVITSPFWVGQTEVTRTQWEKIMDSKPWKGSAGDGEYDDHAVNHVSWTDASIFCERLTAFDRTAGSLPANNQYLLPTEAQWEYACRAGTSSNYSCGEGNLSASAWFKDNAKTVKRVGQKKPNPWGLFDMHGNVAEWCRDCYLQQLPGGDDPAVVGKNSERVARGGSWLSSKIGCRSAYRFNTLNKPFGSESVSFGFRVVLVVSDHQAAKSDALRETNRADYEPPPREPKKVPLEQLKAQREQLREAKRLIEADNLNEAYQILLQSNDAACLLVGYPEVRLGLNSLRSEIISLKQALDKKEFDTSGCVPFSLTALRKTAAETQDTPETAVEAKFDTSSTIFDLVPEPEGLSKEILACLPTKQEWAVLIDHANHTTQQCNDARHAFVTRTLQRFPAAQWSEIDVLFISAVFSELTTLTGGQVVRIGNTTTSYIDPPRAHAVKQQLGLLWLLSSPAVDQFIARAKSAQPIDPPSPNQLKDWLISLGPEFMAPKKKQEALQEILDAGIIGFDSVKTLLNSY